MSRSVTRVVVIVAAPLLAVATITMLGSQPSRPVASRPVAGTQVASLRSLQAGASGLGQLAARVAPPPTATPDAAPAAPAPLALPPAPVPPPRPPRPTPPPRSGVGGAAGRP